MLFWPMNDVFADILWLFVAYNVTIVDHEMELTYKSEVMESITNDCVPFWYQIIVQCCKKWSQELSAALTRKLILFILPRCNSELWMWLLRLPLFSVMGESSIHKSLCVS